MIKGVFAIVGVFFVPAAMIVLIVWFRINANNKRYKLQAELYSKALEKGLPVPADWFQEPKKKRNQALNTGIICIAIGIGMALFFWLSKGALPGSGGVLISRAASMGIIPFLIGVAYLIIYFVEKKQAAVEDAK